MAKALTSCVKFIFLIFNTVFWITGLALLVAGILAKFKYGYLLKLSTDINYNLAPYIMIGCGVFIVLVGLIGCWASMKEHGWALKIYMCVLVLLIVVEVAGAVAGYVMRNKISNGLRKGMTNAVNQYYESDESKSAMDEIQSKIVECCGVDNYTDYAWTAKNSTEFKVPKSCCQNTDACLADTFITANATNTGFYPNGCYNELVRETKDKFKIFGGVALGVAVFQILGIVFGYLLTKQFSGTNYESM